MKAQAQAAPRQPHPAHPAAQTKGKQRSGHYNLGGLPLSTPPQRATRAAAWNIFIAILASVLGLALTPESGQAAPAVEPNPLTCEGYPEPRQYVDAQAWWQQPGDAEARHLHLGACIPERETLTGTVHIDARVQMHANPGRVRYAAIVWETGASGDHTYSSSNPGWTCPDLGDCTFPIGFDIPTSAWDRSGLEGLRLRATARQPDGKEQHVSINFQAYIDNGKTASDMTRRPYLRAKGWYTGAKYCETAYRSDVTPLPDGTVSGTWSPWIRQLDHGSLDADPTHHDVRLDPRIHAGEPGTFLLDGLGPRDGPVDVDTSLFGGSHKLFAKTDCETPEGVNSGVLVVPFGS